MKLEQELSHLRDELHEKELQGNEQTLVRQREIDNLKKEVAYKLPTIAASAAQKVEEELSLQHQKEVLFHNCGWIVSVVISF